jgi:hypothetical protein
MQPSETVTRPDPGLARGKWEAPGWVLWTILAVATITVVLYLVERFVTRRRPTK